MRTSGATPVRRMTGSPTMARVNIRHTSTGTYQRGRARSISSQITSSGTAVPVWSGDRSTMEVALS
jgi:hypothetical protein